MQEEVEQHGALVLGTGGRALAVARSFDRDIGNRHIPANPRSRSNELEEKCARKSYVN